MRHVPNAARDVTAGMNLDLTCSDLPTAQTTAWQMKHALAISKMTAAPNEA